MASHCASWSSSTYSSAPVSYTHLDVYKRQLRGAVSVKRRSSCGTPSAAQIQSRALDQYPGRRAATTAPPRHATLSPMTRQWAWWIRELRRPPEWSGPEYRRLAARLLDLITARRIEAGTQLPPERVLSVLLAVSRGTVVRAYDDLAADGFVERRVGSGTFCLLYTSRCV